MPSFGTEKPGCWKTGSWSDGAKVFMRLLGSAEGARGLVPKQLTCIPFKKSSPGVLSAPLEVHWVVWGRAGFGARAA